MHDRPRTRFSERSASLGVAFTSKDSVPLALNARLAAAHRRFASIRSRPLAQSTARKFWVPGPRLATEHPLLLLLVDVFFFFHQDVSLQATWSHDLPKRPYFISASFLHCARPYLRLTCITAMPLFCMTVTTCSVHARIDKYKLCECCCHFPKATLKHCVWRPDVLAQRKFGRLLVYVTIIITPASARERPS